MSEEKLESNVGKIRTGRCKCGWRKAEAGQEREICFYCEVKDIGGVCSRCREPRGAWSGNGTLCSDCSRIVGAKRAPGNSATN